MEQWYRVSLQNFSNIKPISCFKVDRIGRHYYLPAEGEISPNSEVAAANPSKKCRQRSDNVCNVYTHSPQPSPPSPFSEDNLLLCLRLEPNTFRYFTIHHHIHPVFAYRHTNLFLQLWRVCGVGVKRMLAHPCVCVPSQVLQKCNLSNVCTTIIKRTHCHQKIDAYLKYAHTRTHARKNNAHT